MTENLEKEAHPVRTNPLVLFSINKRKWTRHSASGQNREIALIVMPVFILQVF